MIFSLVECVSWLATGLMFSLAIIILNLITIIVFKQNRNLRRRGTYLMINLPVADMLAAVNATDNFVLSFLKHASAIYGSTPYLLN